MEKLLVSDAILKRFFIVEVILKRFFIVEVIALIVILTAIALKLQQIP